MKMRFLRYSWGYVQVGRSRMAVFFGAQWRQGPTQLIISES